MSGGPYSLTSGFASKEVLESSDCINPMTEGKAYAVPNELLPMISDVRLYGLIP